MTIICGHKWTQNQRKTLKISGKKCIFTNNRLKITGFETFISIGYLSAILIAPNPPLIVSGTEIHDRITGLPSRTLIIIVTSPHTLVNVSLAIFSMWTISTGSTSYSTPTQCIAISSLWTLVISVASSFTISIPTIFSLRTIIN